MKILLSAFAVVGTLFVSGCSQQSVPVQSQVEVKAPVQPATLTPQQELAKYCRVCVVDEGEKMEEYLPSRLDTKQAGKTYRFCKDSCRKKFTTLPAKYVVK